MQYSRAWMSVTASGLILLLLLAFLIVGLRTASASPAATHPPATDMGWGRTFSGGNLFFCIILESSLEGEVTQVEVVNLDPEPDEVLKR